MTHDELLAKIEIRIADFCEDEEDFCDVCSSWKALRAVVELHKPNIKGGCDICSWIIGGFVKYEVCPTIQAIEKELK